MCDFEQSKKGMDFKMEDKSKNSGALGISALVLGIISICTVLFYYMSLPTGILAIVFGAISSNKTGRKIAKAGLVTGIIGVSLCVFLYISMIIIISLATS